MTIVGIHQGWPIGRAGKEGKGSSREPKNSGDRVVTTLCLESFPTPTPTRDESNGTPSLPSAPNFEERPSHFCSG